LTAASGDEPRDQRASVYYVPDQSLVNAEYLRHYCAAYDVFTSDIARDIAHTPGTMQVAFKPDRHWDPTGVEEDIAIAYNGRYLIVAKDTADANGVAGSAVECTPDGGPVTSTDADSGTQKNCESNLPW
jgi:hypothetical protein